MASGDFLFELRPQSATPPTASAATHNTVEGASTPAEMLPVIEFDAAADEYMDWYLTMPEHYAGTTGITCTLEIQMASATSSNVRAAIALRERATTDDWDTTVHTYVYNEATLAVPGTLGLSVKGNITFTDGADMDSVAAGDSFVLRFYRNQGHGDDAASGDALLERIYVTET